MYIYCFYVSRLTSALYLNNRFPLTTTDTFVGRSAACFRATPVVHMGSPLPHTRSQTSDFHFFFKARKNQRRRREYDNDESFQTQPSIRPLGAVAPALRLLDPLMSLKWAPKAGIIRLADRERERETLLHQSLAPLSPPPPPPPFVIGTTDERRS